MRRAALALALVLALAGPGCGGDSPFGSAETLVVVTTSILGDVVSNLAGDEARVEVLMPLGADPHTYEPSARQAARLREADLIVANGLGLEEGFEAVIDRARAEGVPVLYVGDFVDPLPYAGPGSDHDSDGEEADEDGEAHQHEGGYDPHFWMDPVRMQRAAAVIAERLGGLAEGGFAARAAAYGERLGELSAYIEARISTIPAGRRVLVTNHFAYGYYAERYGLEMLATVIPAATTDSETSAAQFARLVDLIRSRGVPAIFASTTEPTRLAEAVAAEAGREVEVVRLYAGSLGEPGSGAESYLEMMRTSTDLIVQALGG